MTTRERGFAGPAGHTLASLSLRTLPSIRQSDTSVERKAAAAVSLGRESRVQWTHMACAALSSFWRSENIRGGELLDIGQRRVGQGLEEKNVKG